MITLLDIAKQELLESKNGESFTYSDTPLAVFLYTRNYSKLTIQPLQKL